MTNSNYGNYIDFSMRFCFTSTRQLTDFELGQLHKALQAALAQQDGPADQLLDALREQVDELDCNPDHYEALGPFVLSNGYPIHDELLSQEEP